MSGAADRREVGVIIPTYNHARFLAAAIRSVLAQTVAAYEIVVVDDGSTDSPESVASAFPQVRLIRQPNRGLAAARNTGLRASTAAHLVFLDADDRLRPRAIASNLDLLARDPEAAFAYGAYCNVNAATGTASPPVFSPVPRNAFGAFLRGNAVGMHATVMYQCEALEAVGGFREGLRACEDYDVYLRLALRYPVVSGPNVLAEYWRHDSNMSRDPAFMLASSLAVLEAYRGEASRAGLLLDYLAGVAEWKRFYSLGWVRMAKDMALSRRFDRTIVRQGLSILRQAPACLIGETAAALARKAGP